MTHSVVLSRSIQAAPDAVYRALSTPLGLIEWCADTAHVDAREGGYFFLWSKGGYQLAGTIKEVKKGTGFCLEARPPRSDRLQVSVKDLEDGAQVSLALNGAEDLEPDIAFWDGALNNLKAVLETGLDPRVYDRPMLGILIAGLLSAEEQERFNSPVDHGIIVSGTVSGLGAADLGLRDNDVLAEMDGVPLRDYPILQGVVDRFKAGDRVDVVWYRHGVKLSGRLTLSRRPVPYIPEGPAELAEYVQGIYRRLDAELDEILEGVSEDAADFQPAENEWSVKEVLAHAILTERSAQVWLGATVKGRVYEDWVTNDHGMVKALVENYPTVPELVAEIRRAEAQTVGQLRRLSPELPAYKGTYMNIVTNFGEYGLAVHTRNHYESIRPLLAAAGRK